MNISTPRNFRDEAQALRRAELSRMAGAIAIKWQTFWKATHAPHPSKVPTPTHP